MAADRADAHELAGVYRDHARAVYGLARRLCGPALAADVTQEVFLSYWRRPERFDPSCSSLRSFLLTITHRRAIDTLRSEGARRHREERTARCPDVVPDVHQQVVERERSATIAGAMGALSTLERQANREDRSIWTGTQRRRRPSADSSRTPICVPTLDS